MSLDKQLLSMAYAAALKSPDPSTQNGAVLTRAGMYYINEYSYVTACNTFPYGVKNTPDRLERPLKYNYVEHAERNVIYAAVQKGWPIFDCTLYVPWFACADCARAIIQTGIRKVVGHQDMFDSTPDRWGDSIKAAFEMFEEAGVETILIKGPIDAEPIRFNGKLWSPKGELVASQ